MRGALGLGERSARTRLGLARLDVRRFGGERLRLGLGQRLAERLERRALGAERPVVGAEACNAARSRSTAAHSLSKRARRRASSASPAASALRRALRSAEAA